MHRAKQDPLGRPPELRDKLPVGRVPGGARHVLLEESLAPAAGTMDVKGHNHEGTLRAWRDTWEGLLKGMPYMWLSVGKPRSEATPGQGLAGQAPGRRVNQGGGPDEDGATTARV